MLKEIPHAIGTDSNALPKVTAAWMETLHHAATMVTAREAPHATLLSSSHNKNPLNAVGTDPDALPIATAAWMETHPHAASLASAREARPAGLFSNQ